MCDLQLEAFDLALDRVAVHQHPVPHLDQRDEQHGGQEHRCVQDQVARGVDAEELHRREYRQRRKRQAEMVAEIVKKRTRPNSSFIILGDMNDPADSEYLKGFVKDSEVNLFNALTNPQETCLDVRDPELPPDTAWTYRYKPAGQPAEYKLYDQIWLSQALSDKLVGSWVDRRTTLGGDGSDHDPAWVELKL